MVNMIILIISDQKIYYKKWPKGVPKEIEIPKKTLIDFLEDSVKTYPQTYFMGFELTYAQLLDIVYRTATKLHELGLKKLLKYIKTNVFMINKKFLPSINFLFLPYDDIKHVKNFHVQTAPFRPKRIHHQGQAGQGGPYRQAHQWRVPHLHR